MKNLYKLDDKKYQFYMENLRNMTNTNHQKTKENKEI